MATLDWDNLAFDIVPTRSHIEYVYANGVWDTGTLVTGSTLNIHMWATALHYGQTCFEGLRAFSMKDGKVRIFRPDLNAARLQLSCNTLSMPAPPTSLFIDAIFRVVLDNIDSVPPYGHTASLYIRPFVIGSGGQIGPTPPDEFRFIVLVNPVGDYYKEGINTPVKTIIQHGFDRSSPNGIGHIKSGGNYAPCMGPTARAKAAGYALNLFVDAATHNNIEEFATSNFAALTRPDANGRRVYVTPKSASILGSITNRSLAELAVKTFGWAVERRVVPWEQLKRGDFDEVVACGTAVVVTPIGTIDREMPARDKDGDCSISTETAICSDISGIDSLWDNDRPAAIPMKIESVSIVGDFSGFKALHKVFRQIQSGDLDGWQKFNWMLPAEGL
ncbi:hypothetical protein BASA50_006354 [Batrachochytrium salamandrivorans]|uniref:Branched-chain amino acid aminotransferase n=1 Tax=Batrachochytrium salamandrivorans TaxID=1357716 RepID=A0ABQ8F9Y0_9FUNG|nr:hypothetical protein BASA62_006423 [Batrachochytrium salamandrivorans]KAH6575720.1 hypothetical protein BASA60_004865 [Batrachochytrium salamandrivorans]KAH6594676.1 hypothetical protein BASA50_006354 [Batrachochytrium salamandrivorans]KAH6599958.1 hypothetical protein BASA61_002425 [Batrachochytrium salamandrivorans]KAH9257525.1 branched-chain amino acid aminotransferase [Batrachochytrium salamandrivorans]